MQRRKKIKVDKHSTKIQKVVFLNFFERLRELEAEIALKVK